MWFHIVLNIGADFTEPDDSSFIGAPRRTGPSPSPSLAESPVLKVPTKVTHGSTISHGQDKLLDAGTGHTTRASRGQGRL